MKLSGIRIVSLLSVGLMAVALGTAQKQRDASADPAKTDDDIREAIFRYRMATLPSESLIFLSVSEKDPSDRFMARFAKSHKTVRKASESYVDKKGSSTLRDRNTNQPGWLFSVGAITWLAPDRVKVPGGMYCDGLCADEGEYLLERQQGHWVVTKYKMETVS